MKIRDFINKYTINPETDINPNFKLLKTIDVNAYDHKGCFNCDDSINIEKLKSSPWTGVQYCRKCNCLIVIYFSDRMSGSYTDTVKCFVEYTENKFENNDNNTENLTDKKYSQKDMEDLISYLRENKGANYALNYSAISFEENKPITSKDLFDSYINYKKNK